MQDWIYGGNNMCAYILWPLKSKLLCDYDQSLGNQVKFLTHSGLWSWLNPIVLFLSDLQLRLPSPPPPYYLSLPHAFPSSHSTIPGSLQGNIKNLFVVPLILLYLLFFPAFAQEILFAYVFSVCWTDEILEL